MFPAAADISFPANPTQTDLTEVVCSLLQADPEQLGHGSELTGRPGTEVFRNERWFLKIRSEYRFTPTDAERWVNARTEQEHSYGVYHPDKVWLLLQDGETPKIANLAPLLQPLHVALDGRAAEAAAQRLSDVVEMTLATAAKHGRLLDGGLSNFAEDDRGRLYYVDDDTYAWDRFLGLSQSLAHWLRSLTWLRGGALEGFAERLRTSLRTWFPQPITPVVLSNHLRDLPMPNPQQRDAMQTLLGVINRKRSKVGIETAPAISESTPDRLAKGASKLALLADIHANAAALEAVLQILDQEGVEDALVLGDLVGYGPQPSEVIAQIRERGFDVLMGNHDYGVAHGQFEKGFSRFGRKAAEWTSTQLSGDDISWLAELPTTLEGDGWMAVHGAPSDHSRMMAYVYRMTFEQNLDYLARQGIAICFHGHTHVEGVYFRNDEGDDFSSAPEQDLSAYRHCLVCPSSVGQPRGGAGCHARFALLDPDTNHLSIRQVPYDVERTIGAMSAAQLPEPLAQRLRDGI